MKGHPVGAGRGGDARFSERTLGDKKNPSFCESLFGFNSGPEACAACSDNQDIAMNEFQYTFLNKILDAKVQI
jgi:hypothetical protein